MYVRASWWLSLYSIVRNYDPWIVHTLLSISEERENYAITEVSNIARCNSALCIYAIDNSYHGNNSELFTLIIRATSEEFIGDAFLYIVCKIVELGTQTCCLWNFVLLVTFVHEYKSEFRITSRSYEIFAIVNW